jgi:hypothetical protein
MATIREVDERMRELLGFPNWDSPNLAQRLALIYTVTDTLSKYVNQLGKPHLVDKFTLNLVAAQAEYSVPRDDFDALYYATSQIDGHEIETTNFVNFDLVGAQAGRRDGSLISDGGPCTKLGYYGVGDAKRLLPGPEGCVDTVTVWYNTATPTRPRLDDDVKLLDNFHLGLVAPAAALLGVGLGMWHWDGMSLEEQQAKIAEMKDRGNDWSLASVVARQESFFRERAYNPDVKHAKKALQGFGHRRRQLRRYWNG